MWSHDFRAFASLSLSSAALCPEAKQTTVVSGHSTAAYVCMHVSTGACVSTVLYFLTTVPKVVQCVRVKTQRGIKNMTLHSAGFMCETAFKEELYS